MVATKYLCAVRTIGRLRSTLDAARLRENAFTRRRKMSFADALTFLLDMRKTTLQTRLNLFFEKTEGGEPISQQAFSKLRMNFDHSPFETMVRTTVLQEYSGKYALPVWNDYHVFAVDGSYLQLPRTDALREEFGVRGGGNQPNAGVSVLYDVLNNWALDPIITRTDMSERNECEKHIRFLSEQLPHIAAKSILTIDRGYPSLDMFEKIQSAGLKFVARCSSAALSEINNAPLGDTVVTLRNNQSVRIVKFVLENGNTATLATNIFDLSADAFPELYSLRWKIETAYFRLKQELSIEKFSGETPNTVRQDFWASMVIFNCVAVFQNEADEAIAMRHEKEHTKHRYRARTSDLIITLRDRFIFATLCGHPSLAPIELNDIAKTLSRAVSPIRPGRHYKRVFRWQNTNNHNLKSRL